MNHLIVLKTDLRQTPFAITEEQHKEAKTALIHQQGGVWFCDNLTDHTGHANHFIAWDYIAELS